MTFDPRTNAATVVVNPLDATQPLRAVSAREGVTSIGGQGPKATVLAWDPIAQRELWRMDPQQKPTGITGLAVNRGSLNIMCRKGDLFVVNLATRAIAHQANHGDVVAAEGTLRKRRGEVHATSATTFFFFDPKTYARTDLVTLDADWYGIQRSALDERGRFYTIKGRDLVRIEFR